MRISAAARLLGTSPRMLRYREELGLLPPPPSHGHRRFEDDDLAAVAAALELERRLRISPAALAFGLRVLTEPTIRAAVADLGRRIGRIPATPTRVVDFEKEKALRLLSAPGSRPDSPVPSAPARRGAPRGSPDGPGAPWPPGTRPAPGR